MKTVYEVLEIFGKAPDREPVKITRNPEYRSATELRFYLPDVDETGNPPQLIKWNGKTWRFDRVDSGMVQAIYRPAELQP